MINGKYLTFAISRVAPDVIEHACRGTMCIAHCNKEISHPDSTVGLWLFYAFLMVLG